ncbi:MAG: hypothetical protein JNL38_22955 [Myxococcales bacterium]|nr:hypothetical protein [Myxococcales bacterium]
MTPRTRWSIARAIVALSALVAGAAVYVARPGAVVVTRWIPAGARASARAHLGGALAALPAPVRGVLPDFLWAASLGCVLGLVWRGKPASAARPWLAAGLALALGWEIGQAFHVVPGTFDPLDLVASLVGYAAGAWAGGVRLDDLRVRRAAAPLGGPSTSAAYCVRPESTHEEVP